MRAAVAMANDVLWEYPAKVVLLFSLVPTCINILASSIVESTGKLNDIPPDLLTDIIVSFLRELDGDVVIGLLNDSAEVVRKLHTGSALLGEAGAPLLPQVFKEKLNDVIEGTDPAVLWKARIAIAEFKAHFRRSVTESIGKDPKRLKLAMAKQPELVNLRIQSLNETFFQLDAMTDDAFVEASTAFLTGWDVQAAAEAINHFLRLTNRLWDQNPQASEELVTRFSNSVDDIELTSAIHRLIQNSGQDFRPIMRSVVPSIVTWICDVLNPEDDEYEADAARARKALRSLLSVREA